MVEGPPYGGCQSVNQDPAQMYVSSPWKRIEICMKEDAKNKQPLVMSIRHIPQL